MLLAYVIDEVEIAIRPDIDSAKHHVYITLNASDGGASGRQFSIPLSIRVAWKWG
jgi:hypothetical protein